MFYPTLLKTASNLQLIPFTLVCSNLSKHLPPYNAFFLAPFWGAHSMSLYSCHHLLVSPGAPGLQGDTSSVLGMEVLVLKSERKCWGKLEGSATAWTTGTLAQWEMRILLKMRILLQERVGFLVSFPILWLLWLVLCIKVGLWKEDGKSKHVMFSQAGL